MRLHIFGSVLVLMLAADRAAAQTHLHTWRGEALGDGFGRTLGSAGDVDRDGIDDIVVGAPEASGPRVGVGAVYVFSGAGGGLLWARYGVRALDHVGAAVGAAGDVNRDGHADVIVGLPGDGARWDVGRAWVLSGRDGSSLWTFEGAQDRDLFGTAVAGVGDADGDGHDDVAVGAPMERSTFFADGTVRVFSGRTGALLQELAGDSYNDRFGSCVAGLGDVDRDGHADFAVAAPLDDDGALDAGRVRVFSGSTGAVLHTFDGTSVLDQFGSALAGTGDVDGDGHADLIVGSELDDAGGPSSGSAFVYSGRDGSLLWTASGARPETFFGSSVGGVGDVDGDGLADVVVGGYGADAKGVESGLATLFCGVDGYPLHTVFGDRSGDGLGRAVALVGDLDADGLADFLVGAPAGDGAAAGFGLVRALNGCPVPPRSFCTTAPNSAGSGARISSTGVASLAARDFNLVVQGAVPGYGGQFYYGSARAEAPFGDGVRCVGGRLFRVGLPVTAGPHGAVRLRLDFGRAPMDAGPGQVTVGSTWYFQFLYLDPTGPGGTGFNLSDGLRLTFCK